MTAVMPSATAPSTPEQAIRAAHPGIRRSFTLPSKVTASQRLHHESPEATPESVETLFACGTAKIVSFSQPSSPSRPSSSSSTRRGGSEPEQDFIGILPWASSTERTMAVGLLRIYRVPGSVSFLHSGDLLHAILPKSQCWCVDGESKFVFRIRQTSYYRIELPFISDHDKQKVEELKTVFAKVLQYETTACPFKRGFYVELPRAKPPIRKKPWRPPEKAKKWIMEDVYETESHIGISSPIPDVVGYAISEEDHEGSISPSREDGITVQAELRPVRLDSGGLWASPKRESLEFATELRPASLDLPLRPQMTSANRSVTAPPQLNMGPLYSSAPTRLSQTDSDDDVSDSASLSSSTHSFRSIDDPLMQTYPYDDQSHNIGATAQDKTHKARHQREISELTITPADQVAGLRSPIGAPSLERDSPSSPSSADPPSISNSSLACKPATPPESIELRHRNLQPHHRASQSLFTKPTRSVRSRKTSTLIERTYAILLSPPAHLVAIMLRIAANFADSLRSPRKMRKVGKMAGAWVNDESEEDQGAEDDYGIPLGGLKATRRTSDEDEQTSGDEAYQSGVE